MSQDEQRCFLWIFSIGVHDTHVPKIDKNTNVTKTNFIFVSPVNSKITHKSGKSPFHTSCFIHVHPQEFLKCSCQKRCAKSWFISKYEHMHIRNNFLQSLQYREQKYKIFFYQNYFVWVHKAVLLPCQIRFYVRNVTENVYHNGQIKHRQTNGRPVCPPISAIRDRTVYLIIDIDTKWQQPYKKRRL